MAIKWDSTTCTVIKWGNTVCSQVKWGNTVVYPDASGIALYSYGANPMPCDIGNYWDYDLYSSTQSQASEQAGYKIVNNDTNGTMVLNTNNISGTAVKIFGISSPTPGGGYNYWKSAKKLKVVCNIQFIAQQKFTSSQGIAIKLELGYISGTGRSEYSSMDILEQTLGKYYGGAAGQVLETYTGGTYNLGTINSNSLHRFSFAIKYSGNIRLTGTLSEVSLLT